MGDNDSYCDSEASMDDGSCYDNLEDVASPPPSDLSHQTLDLRHQDTAALRVSQTLYLLAIFKNDSKMRLPKKALVTVPLLPNVPRIQTGTVTI